VIGMLKKVMPIERAEMRLKITSSKEGKKLKEKLSKIGANVETEEWDGSTVILVCLVDPGLYRQVDDLVKGETKGQGNMELLNLKEVTEGEETLE